MSTEDNSPVDALILIATQSFTCESLVNDILIPEFYNCGLNVQVKLVDEVFYKDSIDLLGNQLAASDDFWPPSIMDILLRRQRQSNKIHVASQVPPVLFVASTYGDGDPPHHATEFANWLCHPSETTIKTCNCHARYAVFGLGDSNYPKYCAFGKLIDQSLAKRGGERILPFRTGDKAKGNQAQAFEQWCQDLTPILQQCMSNISHNVQNKKVYPFPMGTGAEWRKSSLQTGSVTAHIVQAQELISKDKSERSVVHMSFEIPSSGSIPASLQAGDHVGVYPVNGSQVVQRALEWLEVDGKATTTILEKDGPTNQ